MKTLRRMVLIGGLMAAGLAIGPGLLADLILDTVNQVDGVHYRQYLDNLLYTHAGDNRGIGGAQHDLARTAIYSQFAGFGLQTYLDPFTYNSVTYYNAVGVLPGKVHPDDYYIVGAHYDSVGNPGADDNASGVAGVLETARVLAQHQFDASLVFIAFDREEQGLIGSTAFANAHAGDDILGMLEMDMIAYNPAGNHDQALVYGDSVPNAAQVSVANALSLYGQGITPVIGGIVDQSDHARFRQLGFPAALLIEYNVWGNPYYHSSLDSVDTANYIDYTYATRMTRSTVGYVAAGAGLLAVPEPGVLLLFLLGAGVIGLAVRRRRAPGGIMFGRN